MVASRKAATMDGYGVDLGELGAIAGMLRDASGGDLGTPDLNAATTSFSGNWRAGIGSMSRFADALGDGMRGTRAAYQHLDTETAAGFAGVR